MKTRSQTATEKTEKKKRETDIIKKLVQNLQLGACAVLLTPQHHWNVVRTDSNRLSWATCDPKGKKTKFVEEDEKTVLVRLNALDVKAYYVSRPHHDDKTVVFVEGKSYHDLVTLFFRGQL